MTLYQAYKSDQKFGKAAENLKRYLALSQLSARDRVSLQAELDRLNQSKDANRQK
jgi:hypothetical protein